MPGRFGVAAGRPPAPASGKFLRAGNQYGQAPRLGRVFQGLGTTPALGGLFRAGSVVGISEINAMATNVRRGG